MGTYCNCFISVESGSRSNGGELMVVLSNLVNVVGSTVLALKRAGAITEAEANDLINKLKE